MSAHLNLHTITAWHQTRFGLVTFGIAKLGLCYLFVSLAINSGSLWQWALAAILLFSGIINLIKILKVHTK